MVGKRELVTHDDLDQHRVLRACLRLARLISCFARHGLPEESLRYLLAERLRDVADSVEHGGDFYRLEHTLCTR